MPDAALPALPGSAELLFSVGVYSRTGFPCVPNDTSTSRLLAGPPFRTRRDRVRTLDPDTGRRITVGCVEARCLCAEGDGVVGKLPLLGGARRAFGSDYHLTVTITVMTTRLKRGIASHKYNVLSCTA